MSPRHLLPLMMMACATAEDTAVDCFDEEPSALAGTGVLTFEELQEGDTVFMVTGAQGGEHIYGSLRLWNTDEIVIVHYTITRNDDGSVISDQTYRVAMGSEAPCGHLYTGMYGYLGFTSDYTRSLKNVSVTLTLEATDSEGRAASDSVAVIVGDEDAP